MRWCADDRAPALLASAPVALVLAEPPPPALLALAPPPLVRADARAPALLALAPDERECCLLVLLPSGSNPRTSAGAGRAPPPALLALAPPGRLPHQR